MSADSDQDPRIAAVDTALSEWRQGDCVLGEHWFVYRREKSLPTREADRIDEEAEAALVEQQVPGFAVVTQTCDLVRSCSDRPFVTVCPLVEVNEDRLREIRRGRRPAYAYLPRLEEQRLAVDLDRTMTIEKAVMASWRRTPGWSSDAELRSFAGALVRKHSRFAFPDDFVQLAKKLQKRLEEKHEKESVEGRGLRALRELRVNATPSWDAATVTLTFWFVRDDLDVDFEGQSWASLIESWMRLLPEGDRFVKIYGQITTLEDLTAADYVGSDLLDLDHLSWRNEE